MLCNIKSLTSRCLAGGAIAGPVFLKTSRPEGQSGAKATDARLFRNGLTISFSLIYPMTSVIYIGNLYTTLPLVYGDANHLRSLLLRRFSPMLKIRIKRIQILLILDCLRDFLNSISCVIAIQFSRVFEYFCEFKLDVKMNVESVIQNYYSLFQFFYIDINY